MTKDLKKSIFVGSTLPDKAILPPRLWEAYFNLKNTWVFCSCVTTMGRGQPVEGCRVRIVQARPDKGNLWHLTCHLRDQRNLKRMTCNYFGTSTTPSIPLSLTDPDPPTAHAELVFKELGGKDPDNPDFVPKGAEKPAPKVEEAPAVAADVSASDFSDQEIIPPSVPVTPSASPTKASRRPSGYPFEDLHGPRRTPASASSSQGSIVPSSVQSNVSSPFVIVQRQQREPSITILSSDESDGDVARNTTVRTARPRPLPSTAHRNANPAASVEDTPTPKPRRTQDKGKGRAAAPVVKEEDHEADNIRESGKFIPHCLFQVSSHSLARSHLRRERSPSLPRSRTASVCHRDQWIRASGLSRSNDRPSPDFRRSSCPPASLDLDLSSRYPRRPQQPDLLQPDTWQRQSKEKATCGLC